MTPTILHLAGIIALSDDTLVGWTRDGHVAISDDVGRSWTFTDACFPGTAADYSAENGEASVVETEDPGPDPETGPEQTLQQQRLEERQAALDAKGEDGATEATSPTTEAVSPTTGNEDGDPS